MNLNSTPYIFYERLCMYMDGLFDAENRPLTTIRPQFLASRRTVCTDVNSARNPRNNGSYPLSSKMHWQGGILAKRAPGYSPCSILKHSEQILLISHLALSFRAMRANLTSACFTYWLESPGWLRGSERHRLTLCIVSRCRIIRNGLNFLDREAVTEPTAP